jgi:flagellar motor switch/type III secretory pathway protein FliN
MPAAVLPARQVRPVHLLGDAVRSHLLGRAQAAIERWAGQWTVGLGLPAWQLQAPVTPDGAARAAAYQSVAAQHGRLWVRRSDEDQLRFRAAVTGADAPAGEIDDWIVSAVEAAWAALHQTLCDAWELGPVQCAADLPAPAALPAHVTAFGSGAVRLSCDALALDIVVDSAVLRSVPPFERGTTPALAPLAPLNRAAERSEVRLDVLLGSVELDVGTLLDLRVGDVLRLPRRLEQALPVHFEGQAIAGARLGEASGHKAVRLLAP